MKKAKEEVVETNKQENPVKRNSLKNKERYRSDLKYSKKSSSSKSEINQELQELRVKNKNLEQNTLELKKKIEENEDFILRLKAEFDNYRKRVIEEKEKITVYAGESILKNFLKIYDSYGKALEVEVSDENTRAFLDGFKLIKQEMDKFLEEQKVKVSTQVGDDFDPNIHQAILFEEKDGIEKEKVMEIFQKGYVFNGRLLREAMVKIAKPKISTKNQELPDIDLSDEIKKKENKS